MAQRGEIHAARSLRPGASTDPHLSRRRSGLVRAIAALGLERWARLVAVALVPILVYGRGAQPLSAERPAVLDALPFAERLAADHWLVTGLLGAYVLFTLLLPRQRLLQVADLLVSAAIILLAGEEVAPFLPFVLVAVAGPAAREGLWAGLAAGGMMGSLLLVTLAFAETPVAIGIAGAIATILLPPLAGVTAAAAREVMEDRSLRDRRILQEANRLLSSLQAIADEVPGGLDVATVAGNLMNEVRKLPGVTAALLILEDGSGYRQAGRTGRVLDLHGRVLPEEVAELGQLAAEAHPPTDLPNPLADPCGDVPYWLVLAMGTGTVPSAVLLVGTDHADDGRAVRPALQPLAEDAMLALDNARLFEGTRTRAVDAARRQIASDLHDGVAQSLAHLRMELDLLAIRSTSARTEAERLAAVAESALLDLRRTISGLRLPREDALGARLERHLREVRTTHGPRLDLLVVDDPPLDQTTIEDVFRVAQEALSNALRHADASQINLLLDRDDDMLVLQVEDDGIGFDPVLDGDGAGVGLGSMHERAARLQGELTVQPAERGGTRVRLRVPSRPSLARTGS